MADVREARAIYLERDAFRVTTGSGRTVLIDALPEDGGQPGGQSPMELLLVALSGCTGIDVVSIMRKQRQDVTGYEVRVTGERRTDEHPKIYTRIAVEHVVRGRNLNVAGVARAVELSATKYCSVSAMLERAAPIEVSYRVIDEATGAETTGTVQTAATV
jgi:putative redox protein